MRADLWRCQGAVSLWLFARTWFQDPAFRHVFTLWLTHVMRSRMLTRLYLPLLFVRLWHRRTQWRCGVDLPPRLEVGPGFKLLHGWGVVINQDAKIGSNVTVMQGVTIGGTGAGIPVIEDDVIICANATVVGGITIGRGAIVGAGCVVVRDVSAGSNVVGNPQREVLRKQPPRIMNSVPDHLRP